MYVSMETVCIKWWSGSLVFRVSSEQLVVGSRNTSVDLRQRTVIVKAPIESYEVFYDENSRKKYVYIYFRGNIRPFERRCRVVDREAIGVFEIRVVDKEFESYLTIVTPGFYLYDYVILTRDSIAIVLSGNRQVYFDKGVDHLTVYIV